TRGDSAQETRDNRAIKDRMSEMRMEIIISERCKMNVSERPLSRFQVKKEPRTMTGEKRWQIHIER
ncbi:MAG: hypothetical protein KJO79_06970, partial [Verrucomicrobiae bacterium]|nr:hypothetical protein [Verrucomicrobiae bacterium]